MVTATATSIALCEYELLLQSAHVFTHHLKKRREKTHPRRGRFAIEFWRK
jgi:hypothetical protein